MMGTSELSNMGFVKQASILNEEILRVISDKRNELFKGLYSIPGVRINDPDAIQPRVTKEDVIKIFKAYGVDWNDVKNKWWQFWKNDNDEIIKAVKLMKI